MATVFETVRSAADELRAAGVDTPQHDAKLLLAEAFHTDLQLMGDGVERLAEKEDAEPAMERFQTMLARRVKREPLQHITGHAPFRYLDLKVGPGVFIPRPETELVVQEGVDWATRNGMYRAKVVDLCAGSGAIGLAFGNYHLDIADATQMPTLSQLDGTIDIVLTNPPYVPLADIPEQPEARDYDPDLALYGGSADGTLIPERIIARAAKLLRADGLMVMEHDITQGERLAAFARTCGFVDVTVHNDYTGRPRYLTAEKQPAQ